MNEQLNMNEQLGLMNPSKSKSKTPNLDKIKEALVLRPAVIQISSILRLPLLDNLTPDLLFATIAAIQRYYINIPY